VEKIHSYGELDSFEKGKLEEMKPELKSNIQKGVEFVAANGAQFD